MQIKIAEMEKGNNKQNENCYKKKQEEEKK